MNLLILRQLYQKNTFLTSVINHVLTADEVNPTRIPNERFIGDQYHLAFRHGEFHAQKDKAMASIYKYFLGRAPDVDIVQNGGDFYVASRSIKHFEHLGDEYVPEPDGRLKEKSTGQIFTFRGLGKIIAIDYFFGCNDVHSLNWGFQKSGTDLIAFRIDIADALDEESLRRPITREDIQSLPIIKGGERGTLYLLLLPDEISKSKIVQEEMQQMLTLLAQTDFSIIENILLGNIDALPIDEIFWNIEQFFLSPLQKGAEVISRESCTPLNECVAQLKELELLNVNFDEEEFSRLEKSNLNYLIEYLNKRQQQLISLGFKNEKTVCVKSTLFECGTEPSFYCIHHDQPLLMFTESFKTKIPQFLKDPIIKWRHGTIHPEPGTPKVLIERLRRNPT